jgi:hypothetical protein
VLEDHFIRSFTESEVFPGNVNVRHLQTINQDCN